jgi:mannitol/fructose-specific phosphotransferase system IIA component (Ntr-type)
MLAFISTVNAGILASSRFPLALARDRLIPAIFASLTPKKKNPAAAIILTGIMMSASFFLPLEELVKAASTASIIIYILVHLSTIILKEGRVQNYKPSFIVPLYPWPQLVSIAVFFFMLSRMGLRTALTSLIFLAAVSLVYLFYGKKKHDGTAALAHLVERFFIKKKAGSKLENELKQVIIERDQIIEDRFDLLVKNAAIIDINQKMNTTELFYFASSQLDKKLGTGSSILFNLFMAREKSSSTVLTDFIAVPHITVKGKNIFELMIIRNKRGITFSADNPAVKAVFLTASSPDERNFYLKALSALAQIVHSPDFEDKWLNTKTVENIRDLIHLSERQRFT